MSSGQELKVVKEDEDILRQKNIHDLLMEVSSQKSGNDIVINSPISHGSENSN